MTASAPPPRGSSPEHARLPFREQVDFFRGKQPLPSERYDDIRHGAHDRGFIVAGAQTADLVQDLMDAVDEAIADGTTLEHFRERFEEIVAKRGWTGWTGEETAAGRAWRTRTIYQTNLSASYQAGRLKQLRDPDLIRRKPYWMYRHNDSVLHPRPLHVSWDGIVLPADHIWFLTRFPPNGWGCQCYIIAVSEREARMWGGRILEQAPDDGIDPRTGAPRGIDKGWDYMPGARAGEDLQAFVNDKLIRLSSPIAAALRAYVGPYLPR